MASPSYVYLFDGGAGFFKIGKSDNPSGRRMQIRSCVRPLAMPDGPIVEYLRIAFPTTAHSVAAERALHAKYAYCRVAGEWFYLEQRDLDYLRQLAALMAAQRADEAVRAEEYSVQAEEFERRQQQAACAKPIDLCEVKDWPTPRELIEARGSARNAGVALDDIANELFGFNFGDLTRQQVRLVTDECRRRFPPTEPPQ